MFKKLLFYSIFLANNFFAVESHNTLIMSAMELVLYDCCNGPRYAADGHFLKFNYNDFLREYRASLKLNYKQSKKKPLNNKFTPAKIVFCTSKKSQFKTIGERKRARNSPVKQWDDATFIWRWKPRPRRKPLKTQLQKEQ